MGHSLMDWKSRKPGGELSRFAGASHHANLDAASLPDNHPAVLEGRTLFPTRVKTMAEVDRVLVDGHNNPKIGRWVRNGAWAGMPILTLTLEERKSCPRTCHNWNACMGNAMPMPRRHAHGPELVDALEEELAYYAKQDADGFVVRLHILGDFYSLDYVAAWARWMRVHRPLHVFGYTAHPIEGDIGDAIAALNDGWPDRWRIRFSVPADDAPQGLQVTTLWRKPDGPVQPEGTMCPQSLEKTATCGTYGLCWAPAMDGKRIVFTGHGMRRPGHALT